MRKLWAICDNCLIQVVVSLHPDAGPEAHLPDTEEWEDPFFNCPICGRSMGIPDADPTSIYDDETWHRRQAGERTIRTLVGAWRHGTLEQALREAAGYYEVPFLKEAGPEDERTV